MEAEVPEESTEAQPHYQICRAAPLVHANRAHDVRIANGADQRSGPTAIGARTGSREIDAKVCSLHNPKLSYQLDLRHVPTFLFLIERRNRAVALCLWRPSFFPATLHVTAN
jgi:hypothetical protein